ncbi:MGMT family protein [Streptomyces sp. NBC_00234]
MGHPGGDRPHRSGQAAQRNPRDWTGLHTLLGAVPAGRWTTYGDVAAVIGSHAVPVGTHLATCGQCPNPWRVLTCSVVVGRRRSASTPSSALQLPTPDPAP